MHLLYLPAFTLQGDQKQLLCKYFKKKSCRVQLCSYCVSHVRQEYEVEQTRRVNVEIPTACSGSVCNSGCWDGWLSLRIPTSSE